MLVGVPLMSKIIGMKDTFIVVIGALSHAIGRIFFATATDSTFFYVGEFRQRSTPGKPTIRHFVTRKVFDLK